MNAPPVKIIKQATADFRVIISGSGAELMKFTTRRRAEAYVRGWTKWDEKP